MTERREGAVEPFLQVAGATILKRGSFPHIYVVMKAKKRNTTLQLPEELIARTRAYAAAHGTTMTRLIQSHLEKITASADADVGNDVLRLYSEGRLGTRDACRRLGLRDGSELLLALAERRLPVPLPPPHVIEAQAEEFAQLWKSLA